MTDRVNISELKLDSSIWPRTTFDEEAIERYRDCLEDLPPIVVDRETMTVLDGRHRVEAHKREGVETIAVTYENCPPHLFLARAYTLNARHGLPVSNEVRDRIIVELRQGKDGYDPMSEEEIARELGISQGRVAQVIKNLLGANIFLKDKAKVREATRLYLKGLSQAKVAERFGVHQTTISSVIREYTKRKDLIQQHLRNRGYLKSILEYPDRGPWGDAKYPGNTSGYLLVDIIDYYHPKSILDPMEGSGTTGDVAFDMGDIPYAGFDLRSGFDLVSEKPEGEYDLIFWHPPYHDAVDYDIPHPNNLSRCPSLADYLNKLKLCMSRLLNHLIREGHLCILCGDVRKQGIIQPIHSAIISFELAALEAVLIKKIEGRSRYFDYGNAPFIPILHEYVLIFSNK
jgi:AraC-like DNA-binding protein